MSDVCVAAVRRILDGAASVDVVAEALRDAADNTERLRLKNAILDAAVMRLRRRFVFGDDVARWFDAEPDNIDWPADAVARIVVERSCPRPLVERLVASLGIEGADAFLVASNRPGPITLRANTMKNTPAELRAALADEGIVVDVDDAVADTAVVVRGRANLNASRAFRAGRFEVQDAASQRVVAASGAVAGSVVVDFCAGRGGKTLGLAAAMNDDGTIFVNDVDAAASRDLDRRVRALGLRSVRRGLPAEASADVVLVDAPCSSLGVLRRSPDLRFAFDVASLDAVTGLQRTILNDAARLVRPGGRLIYATCSVLREENEGVVAAASVEEFAVDVAETLLPHRQGCDGFFISVLRRRA